MFIKFTNDFIKSYYSYIYIYIYLFIRYDWTKQQKQNTKAVIAVSKWRQEAYCLNGCSDLSPKPFQEGSRNLLDCECLQLAEIGFPLESVPFSHNSKARLAQRWTTCQSQSHSQRVRDSPVRAVQSSPLSSVMNIKCFRPSVGLAVPMSQCAQNVRQMLPCRQFHCDFSCDFRSCQVPIAAQRMLHILGSNSKRIKSVRKNTLHCSAALRNGLQQQAAGCRTAKNDLTHWSLTAWQSRAKNL